MQFLDTLNPEQREAVLHTNGPLLILAGAGLGQDARHHQPHRVPRRRRPRRSRTKCSPSPSRTRPPRKCGRASSRCSARTAAGMWVSTFHALCARLLRREAPAIGLSRDFVIYDSSDQLDGRQAGAEGAAASTTASCSRARRSRGSASAKNRMEAPDAIADAAGWNRRDEQIAQGLRALPERAEGVQRARLRRPAAEDRRAVRAVRARAREVRRAVPLRDGRRVPGHQPAAVPADPAARRDPPQSLRRRRSRSVDLQVARRRPAQHPRLRAGLSAKRRSSSSNATTARRR